MRKILFYQWGSSSEPGLEKILKKNNIEYCVLSERIKDYHADSEFSLEFLQIIHKEQIEAVFSFDYFPIISMLCEINQIPYISWIYDCPMYTLCSHTIENKMNHIFCFDRNYSFYLQQLGAVNCVHYPLAADSDRMEIIRSTNSSDKRKRYACDISFVGNLYNGEKNRLRTAKLSEYTKGYLEGIIEAQLKVYGYNFIKETLSDEIVEEIVEACQLQLGDMYYHDDRQLATDAVGMEVSAREREKILRKLGEYFEIDFYSGSKLSVDYKNLKIRERGYADYEKEMPYIFHNSKINLNITSKTIESGIPLRVFDILSCGGFCLTNYQPEIAEYFVDGEDLVMYTGVEDLIEKVAYYLEHDGEREQIARNGYEKLKREHDLAEVAKEIFNLK